MGYFDFIKDVELRNTLENSIEYIFLLYKRTDDDKNDLYKEETYRVIILYIISIIEAIMLYFYKVRGEKIEYFEYKSVNILPSEFLHKDKKNSPIVVAVRERIEKKEHQIGLHNLVTFFKDKKLIQEKTANRILELNDIRNTFHFSKPRLKKCDLKKTEEALDLLVHTITKAPKSLESKR